mgnify:CR=1 FL=1
MLLSAGADASATTSAGAAPLHFAAHFGRTAVIEALCEAGAPVDATGFAREHGKLRLDGVQLVDASGAPVQLLTLLADPGFRLSCLCVDEERGRVYGAEASRTARLRIFDVC